MKVLVTGAGALVGQGILQALRRSGIPMETVAADPSPYAPGLYWADRRRLVPMARDPGFLGAVEGILREERPDLVLVGTDAELVPLSEHRSRLEEEHGTRIVVSAPDVITTTADKWRTVAFLCEHGFAHPASCLPGGEEELADRVGFPLVVKPRRGSRARGVHLVRNPKELQEALSRVQDPLVQEHVGREDEEFTAGTLLFEPHPPVAIVMRRDLRDGNSFRAWSEPFECHRAEVLRITAALRPLGPANVQFRLREGRPVVFEINTRFSGTTGLRALAGFNEVEITVRHLLLGEAVTQPEIRRLTFLRHWSETVLRPEDVLDGPADR